MTQPLDPVELTRRLIRRKSVTPDEGGALGLLQQVLEPLGFVCHRLVFSEEGTPDVDNLYARLGTGSPHLCFAGHTDVVPPGNPEDWCVDPFGGEVVDDAIIGRGAVDMKGAVACFVAAASRLAAGRGGEPGGSISLLITGDEEGPSINGTRKVLDWMRERGEVPDYCLVGEPSSGADLCDTIKIGRRGSMNFELSVHGTQGHSAYPHHADNPVHRLVRVLHRLTGDRLDEGSEHFEPSTLQVTSVDVGNPATNVIPARATARFNVRFNDLHDSTAVERWVRERVEPDAPRFDLAVRVSGESFLCAPGPLSDALGAAVKEKLGRTPILGTGGGTSDGRFIKDLCPVAELGLKNALAHQVDERAPLRDLRDLTDVYEVALKRLLAC
jgi:succinyl-diaminopimelate desuccinylase